MCPRAFITSSSSYSLKSDRNMLVEAEASTSGSVAVSDTVSGSEAGSDGDYGLGLDDLLPVSPLPTSAFGSLADDAGTGVASTSSILIRYL